MEKSIDYYKSETIDNFDDIQSANCSDDADICYQENFKKSPFKVKSEFTDAELISRFGDFNIRVYKGPHGRETVIIWSRDIPLVEPVLTRVHSECLTGDVLGSLHCDCGQQLSKSLRLIARQGGVLIYLRQEGRGIGLFEKIKSYRLQSQGYDTFEANLMLGHNPDIRSYEMVKIALKDLGIKKIKLLTNNPSKVSDISSLGILISEAINLSVRPCKYNRKYLKTKKQKFSHFSLDDQSGYQYQFYASNPECIQEVDLFLKDKMIDPLLTICAAISLDSDGLHNQQRLFEVKNIVKACNQSSTIRPVLHFSCAKSKDWTTDLKEVKRTFSDVYKIQLNDFEAENLTTLEWFFSSPKVDVPISSESLELICTDAFRRLVKKYQLLIVLDDSKGTGKSKTECILKPQIERLLSCGINRIGLAGGFGPDALDIYFRLKRYFRINFSIDSEAGVKTRLETDISKVKLYLTQLLRNDNPKEEGIQQTKKFLVKNRRSEWESAEINGQSFKIHPNVFHAGKFPSTAWFAKEVAQRSEGCSSLCEIGCGAGVISCLATIENSSLKVVATDLNSDAAENARINACFLNLSDRISVRCGDVLDAIHSDEQFDLIFWALPFGFLDPGTSISIEEAQVFDPGYRALRKLLQTAKCHLTSKGKLLLGFSSDLGHYELLQALAQEVNASIKIVAKTQIQEDSKLQFEILELTYTES